MAPTTPNAVSVRDGVAYIDVSTPKHPSSVAMVDEADLDTVLSVDAGRWFACSFDGHIVYAVATRHRKPAPKVHFKMHRVVLGLTDPKTIVDHADRSGLNNCRSNLRIASRTQNAANSRTFLSNTSGFRGVSLDTKTGRYAANIWLERKQIFLGYWDDPVLAAAAYDGAARALYGRFASRNFGGSR